MGKTKKLTKIVNAKINNKELSKEFAKTVKLVPQEYQKIYKQAIKSCADYKPEKYGDIKKNAKKQESDSESSSSSSSDDDIPVQQSKSKKSKNIKKPESSSSSSEDEKPRARSSKHSRKYSEEKSQETVSKPEDRAVEVKNTANEKPPAVSSSSTNGKTGWRESLASR